MLKFYVKAQTMLQSLKDESGQDLIEYGILAGMITAGAVAAVKVIGPWVTLQFTNLQAALGL